MNIKKNSVGFECCFVLSFGDLSILEICSVLDYTLKEIKKMCDRIAVARIIAEIKRKNIYGIHKAAYPVFPLEKKQVLGEVLNKINLAMEDKMRVSLSAYCGIDERIHDSVLSEIISSIKEYGYTHIKYVRSKEAKSDFVMRKRVMDFVAYQDSGQVYLAPTRFIPDRSYIEEHSTGLKNYSTITISPRLARTLINIANPERNGVLLDPFCGTGTILIEAISMGIRCIGSDISEKRILQTRKNIESIIQSPGREYVKLYVADVKNLANKIQERSIRSIVTEPILLPSFKARPSKKTASELLARSSTLYSETISLADKTLETGGTLAIVVPVVLTLDGGEVTIKLNTDGTRLSNLLHEKFKPSYPIRLPYESTRFVKRAIYIFKAA